MKQQYLNRAEEILEWFKYHNKNLTKQQWYNIEELKTMSNHLLHKLDEKLEEIQAICIGADSPDAIEHGEREPLEELQCCREDLGAISNIVEELQQMLGE